MEVAVHLWVPLSCHLANAIGTVRVATSLLARTRSMLHGTSRVLKQPLLYSCARSHGTSTSFVYTECEDVEDQENYR